MKTGSGPGGSTSRPAAPGSYRLTLDLEADDLVDIELERRLTGPSPRLHVHAPQPDTFGLQRIACSTCGKRRWMLWRATPWYGTDVTCLRCGEGWQDGERCGRPFAPHWRRHSVKAARALYRRLRASRLAGVPAGTPESVSA